MSEERRMILQMLKDGTISVEEAERLMEAAVPAEINGSSEELAVLTGPGATPRRIRVRVESGGKPKVNVKIPFSLVRVGLKMGKSFGALGAKYSKDNPDDMAALEMLKDLDVDELLNSLHDGEISLPYTLVDVEDEEKGENVLVVLE